MIEPDIKDYKRYGKVNWMSLTLDLQSYIIQLETQNKELIEVIKECDDYLKGNKLNYIGNGSILHTKMKKALKTNMK